MQFLKSRFITIVAFIFLVFIANNPSTQQVFLFVALLFGDLALYLSSEYRKLKEKEDLYYLFIAEISKIEEYNKQQKNMEIRIEALESVAKASTMSSMLRR